MSNFKGEKRNDSRADEKRQSRRYKIKPAATAQRAPNGRTNSLFYLN